DRSTLPAGHGCATAFLRGRHANIITCGAARHGHETNSPTNATGAERRRNCRSHRSPSVESTDAGSVAWKTTGAIRETAPRRDAAEKRITVLSCCAATKLGTRRVATLTLTGTYNCPTAFPPRAADMSALGINSVVCVDRLLESAREAPG